MLVEGSVLVTLLFALNLARLVEGQPSIFRGLGPFSAPSRGCPSRTTLLTTLKPSPVDKALWAVLESGLEELDHDHEGAYTNVLLEHSGFRWSSHMIEWGSARAGISAAV